MKFWFSWAASLTLVLFVYCLVFFPWGNGGINSPTTACLSIVKQQSLGIIIYASENEDRFPFADRWTSAAKPYLGKHGTAHGCPSLKNGSFGYAFNKALSRAKEPKTAELVPLIFESTASAPNKSDFVVSLPFPGRHSGRNSVAYADGHVRRVLPRVKR